jgi:hypothetical protein
MNIFKYECWNLDGHILAGICGREFVIDTGSPHTYLASNNVTIGERIFSGSPPPNSLIECLQRNVAPRVAGLIGLDVLSEFDVLISVRKRVIEFHLDDFSLPDSASLTVARGPESVPLIEIIGPGGRLVNAVLDLGARLSYLSIPRTERDKTFGSAWDFWPANPEVERFPVRLYIADVTIANRICPFTIGSRDDVPGLAAIEIVGSEILKFFDMNIALRRNLIELHP